jgi:hypothetical protein
MNSTWHFGSGFLENHEQLFAVTLVIVVTTTTITTTTTTTTSITTTVYCTEAIFE